MADKEVWVQLYIGKTKSGEVFSILPVPNNVDHLKKQVYQDSDKVLGHCDAHQLVFYNQGTELPTEKAPLRPGMAVPTGTTDENPLRVVAPVNQSGQPLRPLLSEEVQPYDTLQQTIVEEPKFNEELDVTCCKLSTNFLNDKGLQSYVNAAATCANKNEVITLLNELENYDVPDAQSCNFSCIIAPSGTGKTQLAATAVAANRNVVYFYTGDIGEIRFLQSFYRPHLAVQAELNKLLRNLRSKHTEADDHVLGADKLLLDTTTNSFVFGFLQKCLIGYSDSPITAITLKTLRNNILKWHQNNKKLLVFLDEVPPIAKTAFWDAMLLRNILRAAGVSPILMSTHSGSIHAFGTGTSSRYSTDTKEDVWCRVVAHLPKYHTDANVFTNNCWLKETERPLVAAQMVDFDEKLNLSIIVDKIQANLQDTKPTAWLVDPGMQLCQLFQSKASDICPQSKHLVIGVHFGKLADVNGTCGISRDDIAKWMQNCTVSFVHPEAEPILFLALTTWKMAYIKEDSKRYFPLMEGGAAISIREAYNNKAAFFTKPVCTVNDRAQKLDGDDLEVLALASITLASFQSDNGIFQGVALPQFLASVFHFMCPGKLDYQRIVGTCNTIEKLFAGTEFLSMVIPNCPSTESSFDTVWTNPPDQLQCFGQIRRPADKDQRDGVVYQGTNEILHVECKNFTGGFNTAVAKKVIHRMRTKCKVSIFFTSKLCNLFPQESSWQNYSQSLIIHENYTCVLILEEGNDPVWFTGENGEKTLCHCEDKTEHLAVIIATGKVAPLRATWEIVKNEGNRNEERFL